MAKELPASASEIAGVAEAAGQLGIEEKNILSFTRTMIDLGEATNLTADEAATSFARFANITKMPQSEFDKLGSVVVELGNNMATTESEIVAMSMRLAAQGKQVGMTESEIMALSGTMSSLGIDAEAGGSAMTMVLTKMQKAVGAGGKDLAKFAEAAGMSSKAFSESFKNDPVKALEQLSAGLGDSADAGGNMSAILDELGISGIREADVMKRLAGNSELLGEAVKTANGAWDENTALTDEAAQRYETFDSKLKIFKNVLSDVGISIGNVLLPAMTKLVESLSGVAEWFSNLNPKIIQVGVVIAALAAAFMLVVGPILLVIGFIPAILAGFAALKTVFLAVGTAIGAINLPLVLIVAAIIAAAALVYVYWEPIKEFFIMLWDGIKIAGIAIWEALKVAWVTSIEFLINVWSTVAEFFSGLWESISNAAISVWDTVVEKWNEIVVGFMEIFSPMVEFYSGLWTTITTTAVEIFQLFSETLSTVWSNIQTIAASAWEIIKNVILGPILLLINLVTGDFTAFATNLAAIQENIRAAAGRIWEALKSNVAAVITALVSIATTLWNNLKSTVTNLTSAIKQVVSNLWEQLKSTVVTTIAGLVTSVVGKWNELKTQAITVVTGMVTGLLQKWDDLKTKTLTAIKAVKDNVIDPLKEIDLLQIGKDIIGGLIKGISSKVKDVISAVKDVTSAITGKIKSILGIASPSRVLAQIGRWTGEGLAQGIADEESNVAKAAQGLADASIVEPTMSYATPNANYGSLSAALSGEVNVNQRDSMLIGAIASLEDKLTNLRVEMDGQKVGNIVTPHVNGTNAVDDVTRYF